MVRDQTAFSKSLSSSWRAIEPVWREMLSTDRAAREGGWLPSLLEAIRTTEEIARQVPTPDTLRSEPCTLQPTSWLHPAPLKSQIINPYTLKP